MYSMHFRVNSSPLDSNRSSILRSILLLFLVVCCYLSICKKRATEQKEPAIYDRFLNFFLPAVV